MSPSSGSDKSHDFSPTGMYHPHRLGSLQEGQPEVFSHHAPMDVDEPHDRLRLPMIRERPIDQPQDFVGFDQQSSTLVPQTAPAKAVSFPVHPRVHQGHIRTRSDQGEPPSATLFSPTSPLAQIAWLPADQLGSSNRKWIEPPRYDPLDMNTWARRGFVGLSLPNEFASSNVFQEPLHMAEQGIATALSDDTATTVSPGIYQDGFSMPPYRTAYVPTTPRTVPMRHQPPIPSSSFSHRARYTLASTRKAYRTPVSKDNVGRSLKDQAVDTGFPSAALEAFYRPPFEGVLPEENGEVATGHD